MLSLTLKDPVSPTLSAGFGLGFLAGKSQGIFVQRVLLDPTVHFLSEGQDTVVTTGPCLRKLGELPRRPGWFLFLDLTRPGKLNITGRPIF